MVVKISAVSGHAVDQTRFWQPLDTCPRGAPVWMLTRWGRSIEGIYNPGDNGVVAWCPKPKIPPEIKELMQ